MVVKKAESGLAINWILALLSAVFRCSAVYSVLIGILSNKKEAQWPLHHKPQDAAVLTLDQD